MNALADALRLDILVVDHFNRLLNSSFGFALAVTNQRGQHTNQKCCVTGPQAYCFVVDCRKHPSGGWPKD